ncbi:MAG: peptidase domain-containing ABC transporter [Hyphomicrobiales bacterium]
MTQGSATAADLAPDADDASVHGAAGDLLASGKAGRCLQRLLDALGWRGEPRHLIEALPHLETVDDIDTLRAVLARLNFETRATAVRLSGVSASMLPCLFVTNDEALVLVLDCRDGECLVFDGQTGREQWVAAEDTAGTAFIVSEIDLELEQKRIQRYGWMAAVLRKFKSLLWQLLGITFLINMFALAVPIYIMNVYDKVIGTRSEQVLVYFFLGIAIIVVADVVLRAIRARAVAYLGARCEALLGAAAFQQLLHMPINMTERAPIGAQITRIKQFEGIRDVFTGTVANTLLDFPFMLISLSVIILVGGAIAWVPAGLLVLYVIMAVVTIPLTRHHIAVTGEARSKLQSFLIEMVSEHRAISGNNAEEVWKHRFRHLAGDSVIRHFRSQQFNITIQTLSQTMVMAAGVATLWFGTLMVMAGDMSLGALIAVMALVWRVLAPLNSAFLSINRLGQVVQTFRQVNSLMRLPIERVPGKVPSFYRAFTGAVTVSRVGFRYTPRAEPALVGATMEIPPGQFVVLTGPSGAGKSTLLKVIAGLYPPQAGAVQIDGLDVRQLDVGELRHAIAFAPQTVTIFHGTVDQNIRLVHPTATDEDIERAWREARVDDYASALPEGRATRLNAELQKRMPTALKRRLMLARAFVKEAPIFLLDEPANGLDRSGEQGLLEKLQALRGKATVIMVTHRPSHMRMADRVIYMERGQILHDASPEQVLPLITS